jgi:diguanylate cyclase (GGDEF)-like protein
MGPTVSGLPRLYDDAADEEEGPPSGPTMLRLVCLAKEPRVLIVDHDRHARADCAAALRAVGCTVDEASDRVDALELFARRRPHLVLLEVTTPFLDGFATCRAIRELPGGADASIVMMTDIEDIESLRLGYDAGATDFITKPINAILLQHRVKYMLRAADAADQLRKSEREIAHLAYHDTLTGLPNRRAFQRYMERRQASRSNAGAVFLIDLDGFKRVNDTFGHGAGDELICEVGRRVASRFGMAMERGDAAGDVTSPIVARLGGDEFVFVDPSVRASKDAASIAEAMLEEIGRPYVVCGHEVVVTASIGIALVADGNGDVDSLIQNADAAMYDAKSHDRNNARFHSPALCEAARERLEMESALRHALAKGQLQVVYQPKIALSTGVVSGAEALVRWHHPERGMIRPDAFIPIAEESSLIVPIGRWILREACEQARRWQAVAEMRHVTVSVNVSPRQFRDPLFLDDLDQILAATGIDPCALELEITEGTLMNDTKLARALLAQLKERGVRLALDDFGTGYSSLGYLTRFPLDTLKVDRSFVRDVADEGSAAITSAVIAMARTLDLTVVAEGVETTEQLEHLEALGCEHVQGFLFSAAMAAPDFVRWTLDRVAASRVSARAA